MFVVVKFSQVAVAIKTRTLNVAIAFQKTNFETCADTLVAAKISQTAAATKTSALDICRTKNALKLKSMDCWNFAFADCVELYKLLKKRRIKDWISWQCAAAPAAARHPLDPANNN